MPGFSNVCQMRYLHAGRKVQEPDNKTKQTNKQKHASSMLKHVNKMAFIVDYDLLLVACVALCNV